jgi:hypothetical protein
MHIKVRAALLMGAFALALVAMLTLVAPAQASTYQQTATTPGTQLTPGSSGGGTVPGGATAGAVISPIPVASPAPTATSSGTTQDNGFPWWTLLIPLALLLLVPMLLRRRPRPVQRTVTNNHTGPIKSGVYETPDQKLRKEERQLPRNPGGPQAE